MMTNINIKLLTCVLNFLGVILTKTISSGFRDCHMIYSCKLGLSTQRGEILPAPESITM